MAERGRKCENKCAQLNDAALKVTRGITEEHAGGRVHQEAAESEVVTAALAEDAEWPAEETTDIQRGTLENLHRRLGHLSYDTGDKLALDPSMGLCLRVKDKYIVCFAWKVSKQSANSSGNPGEYAAIDRFAGMI
ncbi:hypothetical protein F441_00027 [Phytophthora nicotianae CJ01A1]|uniref:Uncharacterized protein n=2 Tax=Phytophthora nicotianae TaxID=4792 RepID=W2RDC1_PHYN3|nr:hypothetical protein PPTG_20633 [Phytophthora nicotianae INRA-310]ETN23413.1 hypothetical protein PPTG_20633 [Phytophthora nicotianae INRA-310]ETP27467.1 hypothetical protein F441_00027 [Phytophthora nicotianae CJ01A1]